MARNLAIENGKLTSDLDANGFRINNLAGGGGGGGGSGGTSNYNDLTNKPQIGGVTLTGNKSLSDIGAAAAGDVPTKTSELENDSGFLTEHQSLSGKQDKLSDAQMATVNGGPYLKTSGGKVDYIRVKTDTDESGDLIVGWESGEEYSSSSFGGGATRGVVNVNGGEGGGGSITVNGGGGSGGSITVNGGGGGGSITVNGDGEGSGGSITVNGDGAFIKIGDNKVSTEDQLNAKANADQLPYPIATTTGALADRTVNTATAGGSFTFPVKVGTAARDFVLVVTAGETAPSVSFPATGVTYVGEGADAFTAEANKTNIWWFSEVGANVFSVSHKAWSTITQGS